MKKILTNLFVITTAVVSFLGTLIPGMVLVAMMMNSNLFGPLTMDAYDGARLYRDEPNGVYALMFLVVFGVSLLFTLYASNRVSRHLIPTD
jgi:cell division protein FtsX